MDVPPRRTWTDDGGQRQPSIGQPRASRIVASPGSGSRKPARGAKFPDVARRCQVSDEVAWRAPTFYRLV